ncbi:unnamed protein product [Allacma fusca]|uniref:MICOS complex subunit MIC60 n=1 Tax=Allacma fusca TaxID=39272 RepID=A0A8J2PLU3_9HEXA|nr:unnamed protein product [Allacma fusca]
MGLGRLLVGIPSWITRVGAGKVRLDAVSHHNSTRALSTIPPRAVPPNDDDRSPRRKKLVAAFGTVLAASGLALAYKVYQDDFSVEYKAQCAEDDCKKCEDSTCLRRMDKEEELIAKANQELEKALKDVKPKAQEATEAALKAYCEASDLIKQFMDKAYCAIENDNLDSPQFEEVWCDVYETAVKRCEKVKDAMNKGQCAWELLCRLREVIENGKNCKYTQCNPLLITAEETLLCAERELLNAKNKMDCIQSESRLVEQYRNLVEDFRRDLKAELESLLAAEDCRSTFTENECAMVLTHAYKKVLRVQKELAQVQGADDCGKPKDSCC